MINKNTYVVLSKENFIFEILNHDGYFIDQIPPCFSTETLAKKFNGNSFYTQLSSTFSINDIKDYPLEISVYKEDLLRRTLSFPNIFAYIKLLKCMQENFNLYSHLLESPNSESKTNILTNLDYPSNYRKSIMNRNIKFSGNKYKLTIDIANCYPSIYSHSITWALLGKDTAKEMFKNKNLRNDIYRKAENIDRRNTALKGFETNGLLTGPYTSRIISEIVLAAIDKIFVSKNFEFSRYVDDYNFYFTSKYDCEKSISEIANILDEYNLKINESKILIEKYPFDILEDYSSIFKQSIGKEYPVYDVLQKAALLDQQGKKGSFKYAFKLLRNSKEIRLKKLNEVEHVFYSLISIMINKPMMSRYAVEMISKLQVEFSENEMVDKLNDLLSKEIASGHDQELIWLLYTTLRYGSKIKLNNIISIISTNNDFAIMMILDLLNNHRHQIVEYSYEKQKVNKTIKKHLKELAVSLEKESMLTKRWFLIYEINFYNLKTYRAFDNIIKSNDPIINLLKSSNINFYKTVFKNRKQKK